MVANQHGRLKPQFRYSLGRPPKVKDSWAGSRIGSIFASAILSLVAAACVALPCLLASGNMADSWWHSAAEHEETTTDWRYTRENTEESGWSAGNQWRSAPWEGNDTGKGEDKSDKFRSCTTLGTKHPSPLDDRKDLLLALFDRLQTSASGPGSFPRAAMGSWTALIVHAAFYIHLEPCPTQLGTASVESDRIPALRGPVCCRSVV